MVDHKAAEQHSFREKSAVAAAQKAPAPPWHFPVVVDQIAESGQHIDLLADAAVRAEVAKVAGLRDLPRLEAHFDVERCGAGLRVAGRVFATVGQNCVVTLEPLTNEVSETVDLIFAPQSAGKRRENEAETQPQEVKRGDPEPLIGGVVDLGALAIEFLILGLDPYPRKSGAVFEPVVEREPDAGPFAPLAKLTAGRDER
jgi:hypothetical protein